MSETSDEDRRINELALQVVQDRVGGANNQLLVLQKIRELVQQRRIELQKEEVLER